MNLLRPSLALARAYLIESRRSPVSLFWTIAFPQLFLFVFAFVFGRGEPERVAYLMPGLLTITTVTSSFFGFSMRLVSEREKGTLRRLRVTPAPAAAVVVGHALHGLVILAASLLLQLAMAVAVFRVPVASGTGTALALAAGGLAFVPMGLFVGSVAKDLKSAPAITNLIVFPMMFLSGSAMPFFLLPDWLQRVARLLPATFLNESLQRALVRGAPLAELAGPAAVLLACGLAGCVLNALLFRWESADPIPRRPLLAALFLLVALLAGIALLGPELEMSRPPGSPTAP